jgi:hypothetical protein
MGSPTRSVECRNAIALNPTVTLATGSLLSLSQTVAADARLSGRDVSGHRWLPLQPIPPGRRA